jgi:tetratricopeptide (TPR) repeat protein
VAGKTYRCVPSHRDLGARVRRARMRLPIVPTQAQAGELIGRSRRWWQELEAGRLDPQLGDLERVADLLGLQLGELLAIGRMTPEDRAARPEHRAAIAEQPPDGDDVNRRDFLRLLSVAATNLALSHSAGDRRDAATDDGQLAELMTANAALWTAFGMATQKPAMLGAVRDQARIVTREMGAAHRESRHREVCAVAGDLFQLAGEVFFDADRYSEAAQCYGVAVEASREAGAFDLWACALTRQAYIAIYDRRDREALQLLEPAGRVAENGDGSLATRHWVAAVTAEAHAGAGDLSACQRALDRAAQVHMLSGPVANGGWLRFDGSRLAEQRGSCFTRLHRPDLAESALREALSLDLSDRRRGLVLADLAVLALRQGHIDEACSWGQATIDIANRGRSGVIKRRLADLQARLAPFADVAEVRHFTDRLKLA